MTFVFIALLIIIVFYVIIIAFQICLTFPAIYKFRFKKINTPENVEEIKIIGSDKNEILLWRLEGKKDSEFCRDGNFSDENLSSENFREEILKNKDTKKVAIFFHGNAESIFDTFIYQDFISKHNITVYQMEYRGVIGVKGIPFEKNVYKDIDETISYISKREDVNPEDILPIGYSIGTGSASYVGEKYNVKDLILIAGFTTLPDAGHCRWYGKFIPSSLIFTKFPNIKRVSKMQNTKIFAFHGTKDTIVPYSHAVSLKKAYNGSKEYVLYTREGDNHFSIRNYFLEKFGEIIENL